MIILDDILKLHQQNYPYADLELVKRAYVFGTRSHKGQVRKNGEPYIIHPLEVAYIVASLNLDTASVCVGLLHDTVEDTEATLEDIKFQFGEDIAELVDSLTKLNKINFQNQEEAQVANFRKMLIAMSKDLRVILVKLSDRLHNMRTLKHLKPERQKAIARETLEIYAPLASRLGLYGLKIEMEDLCFKYLYPEEYYDLAQAIAKTKREREGYIDRVTQDIQQRLLEQGLKAEVSGRPKHLWSIRQKIKKMGENASIDNLFDMLAFRIIVDKFAECYEVLGMVHSVWKPIPGRFKDYIALPKQNGYQSLHTALFGPENERIEVQIRTKEMHKKAEMGVAAHWAYKEKQLKDSKDGLGKNNMSTDETFAWLRQLLEWQRDLQDPTDFLETVKVDLFDEEVYVFTPKGEVRPLRKGSTAIDFAFSIHSDLGSECTGAKVNGAIVNLRYELQNGDVVEVIRTKGSKPKSDWLKFVKTSKAINKIRAFLRQEASEQNQIIGQELFEKALKNYSYSVNRLKKENLLNKLIQLKKVTSERELFLDIAYGKTTIESLVTYLFPESDHQALIKSVQEEKEQRLGKDNSQTPILVDGEDGIAIRYPKCCSPVHGDPIVGFVTIGHGVTVHHKDCPSALNYDPNRRIRVEWNEGKKQTRPVELQIESEDIPGLLASMSQAFHKAGANISAVNCQTNEEGNAINEFTIMVNDLDQLKKVIQSIKSLPGIKSVERKWA
jgi:guanosine-3',5'-bis(diphosphate) 3'-pyrophosphohydrolase